MYEKRMDSFIRKEFLAWLKYDLWCAENDPEFKFADEWWGMWMPPEIRMRPREGYVTYGVGFPD